MTTFEKTAVELERDIALAVAELRRHGGSAADVEALRQQFKQAADDEDYAQASVIIPG